MAETPNTTIELAEIVTGFLSENSASILLLVLLIICKDAISSLISRLTSFSFKKGDSELGLNAATPTNDNEEKEVGLTNAYEKPVEHSEESEIEDKIKEGDWFSEMCSAFESGQVEVAETIFRKYEMYEKDEIEREKNRAIYLFLRFEKEKDNSAIDDLEELAHTAKTEASKLNILTWLSFCLSESMQNRREIAIWKKAIKEFKSQSLITEAVVHLAYSLNNDNKSSEARKLLADRLPQIKENELKSTVFEALSKIEESLGNKTVSIYCKDKSLEYDPNNRDELFSSAYAASNEGIDDISISNYLKLIGIDRDNYGALNNLGLKAQEAGIEIKAIENYKKAADLKNTLAMANQGYLLLGAGFTEEAEEIANKALELEDTHISVHSLIADIGKKKEKQKNEWNKLSEKSLNRQKLIRIYTEQYYLGNSKMLEGEWLANDLFLTNIEIHNDKLEASWEETASLLSGSTYTAKLSGSISGSTFSGQYARKKSGGVQTALLDLAGYTSNNCIGFVSDDGDKLTLIARKMNDDFSLCLSRKKAQQI